MVGEFVWEVLAVVNLVGFAVVEGGEQEEESKCRAEEREREAREAAVLFASGTSRRNRLVSP